MRLFLLFILLFSTAACSATSDLPNRGGTRVVIIGDLNSSYGSTDYDWHVDSVIARLPDYNPDIVIIPGDMIAGQHLRLDEDDLRAMWDAFDDRIATPMRDAGIPFGFTLGNHDGSSSGSFDHERDIAADYWNRPENDPGINFLSKEHYPFWFSYKHGDIFFATWDASSARIFDENVDWLKEQLQTPEAREARYRIVLGHLPLYPIAYGRNRRGEVLNQPDRFLSLFREYGVDMYVSGHNHAYYPGKRGDVKLLAAGAIGQGPRQILGSPHEPRKAYTVLDFDWETGDIRNTTRNPDNNRRIMHQELPVHLHGIQGYLVRDDITPSDHYNAVLGTFHTTDFDAAQSGASQEDKIFAESNATALISGDTLVVSGWVSGLGTSTSTDSDSDSDSDSGTGTGTETGTGANPNPGQAPEAVLQFGPQGTDGEKIIAISLMDNPSPVTKTTENNTAADRSHFEASVQISGDQKEMLATGMLHVAIRDAGKPGTILRGQLLPDNTQPPPAVKADAISVRFPGSGNSENGINSGTPVSAGSDSGQAGITISWGDVMHPDGFPVAFIYQIAKDREFQNVLFHEHTRYRNEVRVPSAIFDSGPEGNDETTQNGNNNRHNANHPDSRQLFHRVISTDGKNVVYSETVRLMQQ